MIKATHKNRIKMELVSEINIMRRVFQKHINTQKCYCCGSGMNKLNNCEIIYTIVRYQWFDRTGNVHSFHQQAPDKGYEQTAESDTYVSMPSKKTRGWRGLKIIFHGSKQVTKDGSDLREMIMLDSGTTINLFGNTNMIKNRQKADIPTNVLTNAGSKIGDEVGEITGSGKNKFHPEMIANVLSLNEMTKNTK